MKKGFTLIELLVVISIIGLLAAAGMTVFSSVQKKARDTRRKTDIHAIRKALDIYYTVNNKYPPAGGCAYNSNCYVYSTSGSNWIPALVPDYMQQVPQDPKNSGGAPWGSSGFTYAYGNVLSNGQEFDLTAHLEDTNDPDRCEVKQYRWWSQGNNLWCGSYSKQIYELSPHTFP